MTIRTLAAVLALFAAPLAARAADDQVDNPYKNAKVGDFATYKMTTKIANFDLAGTITQTVTAKSDKEATIKITGMVGPMEIPVQEQKIDLTKPFDPAKGANLPGGGEAKVEKLKEGKEKIKAGGKEYETTWTTYKVNAKAGGNTIEGDVKVWMSKDVATGMVKMTMTADVAKMKMEMTMELSETGSKK